ncbi:Tryptophanase [Bienertia sinuspersici]
MLDTNQPFRSIESPFTNPLMEVIREHPNVQAPSAHDIAERYLPEECNQMKEYIKSFEPTWNERGVTIMCDGWSGPTNMHIIKFLVYSSRGTVFHKSIDATDLYKWDVDYYFQLMKKVVEEIGEKSVVQIVTNNEAAVKAVEKKLMEAFPHLYWTASAAHCLDLLLEDIGNMKNIKLVMVKAKKISQFIYHYKWAINYMKEFTSGRDLTRPGITRFATQFVMLESVFRHKSTLQEMFDSTKWLSSRYGQMPDELAAEVRELL